MQKIQGKIILFIMCFMLCAAGAYPMFQPLTVYGAEEAEEIGLSRQSVSITVGKSFRLEFYNAPGKIKWSSSKPRVASVNRNGTIKGLKKGTAVIRANVNGETYSCRVRVERPTLSRESVTITVGEAVSLQVKGTNRHVSWSSNKSEVASVFDGIVTGEKIGTATVTAKVGGKKYKCKVNVISKQTFYVDRLEALVNKERSKYGVFGLDSNAELRRAAQIRAKELYRNYSDTRPNGTSCFSAIRSRYKWKVAAEVTARKYVSPKAVVNAWAGNSDNLAVLLNTSYNDMGAGVYLAPDGYLYWCVLTASQ